MFWKVSFYQKEDGEIPAYELLHSGDHVVLLHGFKKKTDKTPRRELERAWRYKVDYERRIAREKT